MISESDTFVSKLPSIAQRVEITNERCLSDEEVVKDFLMKIRWPLLQLLDEAPSDSVGELFLHQSSRGYRVLIEVYSSQRRFISGAVGKDLFSLGRELMSDLHNQVNSWKSERFAGGVANTTRQMTLS